VKSFIAQLGITIDLFAVFIVWGLIFTRTFVMLMMTPFLAGRGVSGRIRIVVAFLIATFVFGLQYDWNVTLPDTAFIIALFCKEIFFGLAIGFTALMCFYAIEAGGRIVDNQRGSANAQIFIPQLGQVSIFGLFQFWLGVSLFLSLSGHIPFLKAFIESFQAVPVLSMPRIEPGISPFLKLFVRMSADVLLWGMQLAAPVLIAIFLTDLVLGIANKMAPQIPVFELGFLIKGYVGILMVYVSVLVLVSQMDVFLNIMNQNVQKMVLYFAR
jgi:flagellar biosynthetic protein FliR